MPNHIAIQPGRLYPQPGYSVGVDKEGKWTATQIFLCHRDWAVKLMPRPGTVHPEIPFIAVSQVAVAFTEADLAEITCHYSGAEEKPEEDEKANATYTMGLALSEEPLLSHPRYEDLEAAEVEALKAIAAGKEKDGSGTAWKDKVTSELGKEALAKIMRGQTAYYSPKVTWKESWVRDKPAKAAELNKIGEIDTPSGPAPELAGSRTWLRNGVTQTQEGKAYRLEIEWLASDRGGWDPHIYTD